MPGLKTFPARPSPTLLVLLLLFPRTGTASPNASASELNTNQIRMVADRLRLDQCRSLVESLHSDDYELDHTPDGKAEAQALSCFRLLDLWNRQRPANSTFHLILVRLQELGHRDLADALSKEVYREQVLAVKRDFLNDPFKKLGPKVDLRKQSELVPMKNDPEAEAKEHQQANMLELVTFALAMSLIMLLATFICNRITSSCTIKLPQRNVASRLLGNRSGESEQRLLPESV
ncbi:hypothetical protein HPB47_021404 [Ixodes persulcatus]|uniref:Uncharacterized protein n=1 Tax=Ixodes persulcatus TaxID=34615 RepID=A0AC60QCL5_IXOPE|nr:hypothetical protein HPB47_021404 [Ixodes persulcatus]